MKRADARRLLVTKYLRSSGPVTLGEIAARFGWTARVSQQLVRPLVREGTVAEGDFVPDRPSPQFCWQANLEALHRETLKRLKSEIEPLSAAEYIDFVLRWQHAHPSTRLRGKSGVLEGGGQRVGASPAPRFWSAVHTAPRKSSSDKGDGGFRGDSGPRQEKLPRLRFF